MSSLSKVNAKSEFLSVSSEGDEVTAIENGFDEDNEVRPFFKWSAKSTRLLLSLRFQKDSAFSNPKSRKKQLWDSVADDMYRNGGYRVSGVLCDLKFRNMMHTYKKNREKENSGNSSLIVWEYYKEFNDAVGHKFNGSRTNNFTDSIIYDDTLMEAPNEIMEPPNDQPNDDNNLQYSRVDQEDNATVEFPPHISSKRKIRRTSFNEDDYINRVQQNPAEVISPRLTEDERNECAAFGNSVGSQLQNIKDSYSRALTKLKVQKILFLAQTGRLALNNERW